MLKGPMAGCFDSRPSGLECSCVGGASLRFPTACFAARRESAELAPKGRVILGSQCLARRDGAAEQGSKCEAASMAEPRGADGIVIGEEIPHDIADGVQSR